MARNPIWTSFLPVAALLAAGPAPAQPGAGSASAPIESTRIAGNIYLITGGSGANSSALAGDDGILLVDSKTTVESAAGIVEALAATASDNIRFLVNTHEHPDHTGGNETIAEHGPIIIAHEGVRAVLAAGQRGGPPAPKAALPLVTIGAGQTVVLHLNGETVEIMDMPPAHTSSNVMVHYVDADIYHLGDLYTRTRYPVIAGGSLRGFIDSVDIVLAASDEDSRFIPGVGDIGDRADLLAFRSMLATVGDRVADLVEQGESLEEVTAANPTAEFDGTYGDPSRLFLPVIYRQLIGE